MFQQSQATESRYTRAISSQKKNYNKGGNALTQLYKESKAHCAGANGPFACFAMHRRIFYYEFSIELFKPDKDQRRVRESHKKLY
jgi:hypothetical protein